jgi:hypothetical protein
MAKALLAKRAAERRQPWPSGTCCLHALLAADMIYLLQALLLRCERLALERANAQTGAGARKKKIQATFRAQLYVSAYYYVYYCA